MAGAEVLASTGIAILEGCEVQHMQYIKAYSGE